MGNIDLKNKKNRSLALMLVGGLFCVLPPLMTDGVGRWGLEANVLCLSSPGERYGCGLVLIEVKHLMGIGVALIAYGAFVRFSKED